MLFKALTYNPTSYHIQFNEVAQLTYYTFTCKYATGYLYIYFRRYPWNPLIIYINNDVIIQRDNNGYINCNNNTINCTSDNNKYNNKILWYNSNHKLILDDDFFIITINSFNITYIFDYYCIIQYQDNIIIQYNDYSYYIDELMCKYMYRSNTLSYNNNKLSLKILLYDKKYCIINYHIIDNSYVIYKSIIYPHENLNDSYNDITVTESIKRYTLPVLLHNIFKHNILCNYITTIYNTILQCSIN